MAVQKLTRFDFRLLSIANAAALISIFAVLFILQVIVQNDDQAIRSTPYLLLLLSIPSFSRAIILYKMRKKYASIETALFKDGHNLTASMYRDRDYFWQLSIGMATSLCIPVAIVLWVAAII